MNAAVRDIPFARPEFDEAEVRAVRDVLNGGWVSQGPAVGRFEQMFAERVGARYAVATSSCTTALHLALVLAGVGRGDEVICPSYSFIATANAALYAGATPIFADIDRDTWNIDPDDVRRRISERTKVILPVHQVGLAADLDRLAALAGNGIAIVEDAACALGSTYRGRPIGSHAHVACFSFHGRKTISTGEGGMLTTDDRAIAERARRLRSHGASVSAVDRHAAKGLVFEEYGELGFNYRLSDVQAAIGIAQMDKLDGLVARRRAIADRYDAAFRSCRELQLPARPPYAEHAFQSYGVMLTSACRVGRDDLLRALADCGISCRRGIPPIHSEPLYRPMAASTPLPVTEEVAARSLFLPMYASLAAADQDRVIDAVMSLLAGAPPARPPERPPSRKATVARRSFSEGGSGARGPRERRRGGSAGAKPPGSSPLCGSEQEWCPGFSEAHNGPGAPPARPPERSGARGPRERRRGGSAGAKPPGST